MHLLCANTVLRWINTEKFHVFVELTFYLQKQKAILKIETMGLVDEHDIRCEKEELKKKQNFQKFWPK